MPPAEAILAGLTTIANEWQAVAVFWHGFFAILLLAIAARREVSHRLVCTLLVLPLLSVSALAWVSQNPFNGAVFAALSVGLVVIAHGLHGSVQIASWPLVVAGGALVALGWTYPHFLETRHWSRYLIAAPLGLLPCPTLSAVSGLTLIVGGRRSTAWNLTLAGICSLYGVIGVFRLGVALDAALLAGAATLVATVALRSESLRPGQTVRIKRNGRARA